MARTAGASLGRTSGRLEPYIWYHTGQFNGACSLTYAVSGARAGGCSFPEGWALAARPVTACLHACMPQYAPSLPLLEEPERARRHGGEPSGGRGRRRAPGLVLLGCALPREVLGHDILLHLAGGLGVLAVRAQGCRACRVLEPLWCRAWRGVSGNQGRRRSLGLGQACLAFRRLD